MERIVINDANAPSPIGPYNQAIVANGFVFTAGQIGVDPSTGDLVGSSIGDRVEQIFKNLSAVLERAGTDLSKVVKFTVFLADMADYNAVNDVFSSWLDESSAPARSLVAVKGLPARTDVEIECIAVL